MIELSKNQLRKAILSIRNSLLKKEVKQKSEEITQRLEKFSLFKQAKNIFSYVSFGNEVNTHEIIKKYLGQKQIIVPITQKEIILCRLNSFDDLKQGRFGIPEPKTVEKIEYWKIDLALVPGIVFDISGSRIGFGHGYYDQILKKMMIPKVALCYDFQVKEKIPSDPHDVKMDYIITEKRLIDA